MDEYTINNLGEIVKGSIVGSPTDIVDMLNSQKKIIENKQRAIDALKKMMDTREKTIKECLED